MQLKHNKFNGLLENALTVKSADEIYNYCADLCKLFEFDFFCHAFILKKSLQKPESRVTSNYTQHWREYYFHNRCHEYDPVFDYISSQIRPITWQQLMACKNLSQQSRNFMSIAAENQLISGICFPVHGAHGELGSLVFSNSRIRDIDRELGDTIYTLDACSRHLHEAAYKIYTCTESYSHADTVTLTPREKECLFWCAEGKSNWEISKILQISESVVAKHIRHACKKLGVFNRHHAVAKAINLEILAPDSDAYTKDIMIYSQTD